MVVARVKTPLAAEEAEVTVVSSRVVDQALHTDIPAGIIFIADPIASQMRWMCKALQSIPVCSGAAAGIADGYRITEVVRIASCPCSVDHGRGGGIMDRIGRWSHIVGLGHGVRSDALSTDQP